MSTRRAADPLDPIFKALADRRRRAMLDLLRPGPLTTGDLAQRFAGELDRTTVMQHLRVLERAGLVVVVRRGRHRWNHLNPVPIQRIHDRWIGPYADGAVRLLDRLDRALDSAAAADARPPRGTRDP